MKSKSFAHKNIDFLKLLALYSDSANIKRFKSLILHANKHEITTLSELVFNVIYNNLDLKSSINSKLNKYKNYLRDISKKILLIEQRKKFY